MIWITVEQVIAVQAYLIHETGGTARRERSLRWSP